MFVFTCWVLFSAIPGVDAGMRTLADLEPYPSGTLDDATITEVAPGVQKLRIGEPEDFTPSDFRVAPIQTEKMERLPAPGQHPFITPELNYQHTPRGLLIRVPLISDEEWYGGGLVLSHFRQTARRRELRVTSDPVAQDGSSHAPVPFFVSTEGYGFLIDSAREVEIAFGGHTRKGMGYVGNNPHLAINEAALYDDGDENSDELSILIPRAQGVDIFLIGGPTLGDVTTRHVLFAGGGYDVPEWGLGVMYHGYTPGSAEEILKLAEHVHADGIPVTQWGIGPGWQTEAYSSSFIFSPERFPDPKGTLEKLYSYGYEVNIWTQPFVHPSSPLYEPLYEMSGDHVVWNGLVPDYTLPEARKILAEHMRKHVEMGVTSFKLDEVDNSDTKARAWSWPDHSRFPNGADGELMHGVYGNLYMMAFQEALNDAPTYGLVRHAGAFSTPLPYVLYSDLYDHESFLRGVGTAAISGLLWTPETRHGGDGPGLVKRMAAMVLAPQFLINAWYCPVPPWHQPDKALNQAGVLLPEDERKALTNQVRAIAELRMKFVPQLAKAFRNYEETGVIPFRPPVMLHPDVLALRDVDDAWFVGDDLYFAPFVAGTGEREIIMPPGAWIDYHSGEKIPGNTVITRQLIITQPPIFYRAGTKL